MITMSVSVVDLLQMVWLASLTGYMVWRALQIRKKSKLDTVADLLNIPPGRGREMLRERIRMRAAAAQAQARAAQTGGPIELTGAVGPPGSTNAPQ